jgi:hypothetical protein
MIVIKNILCKSSMFYGWRVDNGKLEYVYENNNHNDCNLLACRIYLISITKSTILLLVLIVTPFSLKGVESESQLKTSISCNR